MAAAAGAVIKLLRLSNFPILQQLRIEEALLRATPHNWFVINDGTPGPAVVLGVSGKPHELVHVRAAAARRIPLIKRFTGGGTVVVDRDTIFTALIMQQQSLPAVEPYPRPIVQYTEQLYGTVLRQYGDFRLQENDYCFGDRKFGGNAQAITKDRWVHHTSLLWDFREHRMALLKQPAKQPDYRQHRDHLDFVVRLHQLVPCRRTLIDQLCAAVQVAGFRLEEATLHDAEAALAANTLCGTKLLDMHHVLEEEEQQQQQQRQPDRGQQEVAVAM